MDLNLLRRLIAELDPIVRTYRIDQVYALPRVHLAVALPGAGTPRLWFSAEADEPHLYLRTGRHAAPSRPPAFAMAVRKRARGRRITRLRLLRDDRIVELGWGQGGERLVFELMPRRASAFLLDDAGRVLGVWNPKRGRPQVGEPYVPPASRDRRPPEQIDPSTWTRIERAAGARVRVRELIREIDGVTLLVAADALSLWQQGRPLPSAVDLALQRAAEEPTDPRIYRLPPATDAERSPASQPWLSPYPLAGRRDALPKRFESLTAAATFYYPWRADRGIASRARAEVDATARRRARRLRRAREQIVASESAASDPRLVRQRADLILAYPQAPIHGARVCVPNDYESGEPIDIAIDPALDMAANAQRLYRRARRLERKARHDEQRIRQIDRDLEELVALASDLGESRDWSQLRLQARRLGIVVRPDDVLRAEATIISDQPWPEEAARPRDAILQRGVARFQTARGQVILVGRSATANDNLTQRIAAPHDWWLHALGPGSHVVLRNPGRASEPPSEALRQAAGLAAWFSKARRSGKVEVHWTQARHVRKPRKAAPGKVALTQYRSLIVQPLSPRDLLPPRASDKRPDGT